ncbi:unnamed protein product [Discosporangium mesarthrocarpum]
MKRRRDVITKKWHRHTLKGATTLPDHREADLNYAAFSYFECSWFGMEWLLDDTATKEVNLCLPSAPTFHAGVRESKVVYLSISPLQCIELYRLDHLGKAKRTIKI